MSNAQLGPWTKAFVAAMRQQKEKTMDTATIKFFARAEHTRFLNDGVKPTTNALVDATHARCHGVARETVAEAVADYRDGLPLDGQAAFAIADGAHPNRLRELARKIEAHRGIDGDSPSLADAQRELELAAVARQPVVGREIVEIPAVEAKESGARVRREIEIPFGVK